MANPCSARVIAWIEESIGPGARVMRVEALPVSATSKHLIEVAPGDGSSLRLVLPLPRCAAPGARPLVRAGARGACATASDRHAGACAAALRHRSGGDGLRRACPPGILDPGQRGKPT